MKKIFEFLKNKKFRCVVAEITFILWVIWLGNYWFLFGIPVIFDMYITKKVNWSFWKKRDGKKNSMIIEWLDALIFAVVAVTIINIFLFQNYKIPTGSMEKTLLIGDHLYVSKVAYGPKIPNTPLAFPFAQHTLPFTTSTPSYLEWIKWPYKRLKGFNTVQRNDIVVFNFPEGDTVVIENQTASYYSIVRQIADEFRRRDVDSRMPVKTDAEYWLVARDYVWKNNEIVVRPMDKMDNYIKRCVAIPGDTLKIIDGQVFINSQIQENFEDMQYNYFVRTNGTPINPKSLARLGIYPSDIRSSMNGIEVPLTSENLEKVKKFTNVISIEKSVSQTGEYHSYIFPHSIKLGWNEDNFGPLVMPKKGTTVTLTIDNLPIYERAIDHYESNDLIVKDSIIYINGKPATSYTFKQDYYFMMGDNRHNSADSRFWGFVPEDHIIGKPKFIWLSLDPTKSFPASIRWKRMFSGV